MYWRPPAADKSSAPHGKLYCSFRLDGPVDVAVLERACSAIIERHESLRSIFDVVDGGPAQRAVAAPPLRLEQQDLSTLTGDALAAAIRKRVETDYHIPIDQRVGPLVRGVLLRTAPEAYLLVFFIDHSTIDGWSIEILERELRTLYRAFVEGRPSPLPPLPIQIADFAVWQQRRFTKAFVEAERKFWYAKLHGGPADVALPFDRPRDGTFNEDPQYLVATIDARHSETIANVAVAHGGLFVTLWAAFLATLYTYAGQDDLVVGTLYANRRNAEVTDLIASFSTLVPVRTRIVEGDTLSSFCARARKDLLEAFEHVELPHGQVVAAAQQPPKPDCHPLFNVLFQLNKLTLASPDDPSPRISSGPFPIFPEPHRVDLYVYAYECAGHETTIHFDYNPKLFDRATVERIAQRHLEIIDRLIDDPSLPLSELRRRYA
jgi:hypothetical protein